MQKRKLTKKDMAAVKAAARSMSSEYGANEVKAALADFGKGSAIGCFDDSGNLVGWQIVDELGDVIGGIGQIEERLPQINPRRYDENTVSMGTWRQDAMPDLSVGAPVKPQGQSKPKPQPQPTYQAPEVQAQSYIRRNVPEDNWNGGWEDDSWNEPNWEKTEIVTNEPPKKKKRGWVKVVVALIVIAILGAVGFGIYKGAGAILDRFFPQEEQQVGPDYDSYEQIPENALAHVIVAEGDSVVDVRDSLCRAGLPNIARDFVSACAAKGVDSSIKAGDYIVRGDEDAESVALRMADCDRVPDGVIGINEGETVTDIAAKMKDAKVPFDAAAFIAACADPYSYAAKYSMLSELPAGLTTLEGYFETGEYNLHGCADARAAVELLLAPAQERFNASGKSPREWFEVLTKASLVEKEALFDEDRPLIASVIDNRLREGMQLQIDASIKYISDNADSRVMYGELEIDSPYNTYKNFGLPLGPICSGISEASKAAVLDHPPTDFLYYVLKDKEGHHTFSSTEEQFAADKAHYLELYGYEDSW